MFYRVHLACAGFEKRRNNQDWIIQRHWQQHRAHKTHDDDKTKHTNTENQKDEEHGPHYKAEDEPTSSRRVSIPCLL